MSFLVQVVSILWVKVVFYLCLYFQFLVQCLVNGFLSQQFKDVYVVVGDGCQGRYGYLGIVYFFNLFGKGCFECLEFFGVVKLGNRVVQLGFYELSLGGLVQGEGQGLVLGFRLERVGWGFGVRMNMVIFKQLFIGQVQEVRVWVRK